MFGTRNANIHTTEAISTPNANGNNYDTPKEVPRNIIYILSKFVLRQNEY